MKAITLTIAAIAALAMLSLTAPSADAHGRRVVVVSRPAVYPIVPIYRPRVVLRTAVPVITPNYFVSPYVVIPQGPYWGTYPVGTATYVGW